MTDVVRKLHRAGYQRFESGRILYRDFGRSLDGVYLAGYCIECCLKVLILKQVPARRREHIVETLFRGKIAHDFEWLHEQYRKLAGNPLPNGIQERIRNSNLVWSPELRYETGDGNLDAGDVDEVLDFANEFVLWVKEHLT